jgi:hypothetical protein
MKIMHAIVKARSVVAMAMTVAVNANNKNEQEGKVDRIHGSTTAAAIKT